MEERFRLNPAYKTYLIFLLILSVCFIAASSGLKEVKFASGADEGYYLRYAAYISQKGLTGFADLFKSYLQDSRQWVFPNPLRIGFILLSCLWVKLFGASFINLAYLSLFSYLVFLCACFYFTKRYFGGKIAILLSILLAFSPLEMAMARRALMDSAANLFTGLSIWLFWDNLQERKARKTILFILIYAFTILIRENSVLLSLFFMLYLLIRKKAFQKAFNLTDLLSITVFPFAIVAGLYLSLAGGISGVFEVAKIILNSPASNQYAILFGCGPWFRYLIDFMLLSPWVCILAVGFFFYFITGKEWREEVFYLLIFSATMLFLLNFFTKNVRYLIMLDMPLRLFAVLMLKELSQRLFNAKAAIALTFLVILIAFFDYLNFRRLFIQQGLYDPVTYLLLKANYIIP